MSRVRTKKSKPAPSSNEWPAVVYFLAFGMTLMGYLIGRIVLNDWPHPYHWLSALVGGLIGIPLGWLWYRWRGDVF